MINTDSLGKKRILRFEPTKLDLEGLATAPAEEEMPAVLSDFFIKDLDNGLWSATFRVRKIDKKALKQTIQDRADWCRDNNVRMKKKAIKEEALASMIPFAPIFTSEAFFFINDQYAYIFGKHKKVLETLFSGSCYIPDPYENLTPLWQKCGMPCDSVVVTNGEWQRSLKNDGKQVAEDSVGTGGSVTKFSDVFSYGLCLGHLVVAGEFTDIESVDQVIDAAELALAE